MELRNTASCKLASVYTYPGESYIIEFSSYQIIRIKWPKVLNLAVGSVY